MIKAKDREMQFKKELKKLLNKYNTELEMEEINRTYAGSEYEMVCYLDGIYDKDGDCIAEMVEVRLGTYIDGD